MTNLGKALTIVARHDVQESIMHEDVAAFGAPSECHALVSKGEARRRRIAMRHARSVSGIGKRFDKVLAKLPRRVYERLCDQLNRKMNPFIEA